MFNRNILVSLGTSQVGLTLYVTLTDLNRNIVSANHTNVVEIGGGNYGWYYSQFEDTFQGYAVIHSEPTRDLDDVTILASIPIDNPNTVSEPPTTFAIDHRLVGIINGTGSRTIQLILRSDYLDGRFSLVGVSSTNPDGTWVAPIIAGSGTYVVLFINNTDPVVQAEVVV